ncbi:IS5/IS1182 family transposase, partial [Ralstonia solanacearum]
MQIGKAGSSEPAQIADKGLAPGEAFVFNSGMLKTPTPAQHELEMVTLEELVPKDHLLRKIDAAVDFEWLCLNKLLRLHCVKRMLD